MRPILYGAAVTALLMTTQSVHAQGFLKRLADRAVEKVEQNAEILVEDVLNGSAGAPKADAPKDEPPAPPAQTSVPAPADAAPAVPATKPRFIDSLKPPPDIEAKKVEYNKFGEVSCDACEGGVELDGRPPFPFDEFSGKYNERAKRAGSWSVGHVHRWRGKASTGTLTVISEEAVEGFRCRQLEYRVARGGASAGRPGLICFGLANSSSDVESWHEIY